jgi:hypothetical protein
MAADTKATAVSKASRLRIFFMSMIFLYITAPPQNPESTLIRHIQRRQMMISRRTH